MHSGGPPSRPRTFTLRFGFPVPGGAPDGALWRVSWEGAAVMGVLNVTPDSFSDGGRHALADGAVRAAVGMWDAGALVVDVGGESTRPGAQPVTEAEELARVLPVVEALAAHGGGLISVDTMKPAVAGAALRAGAHLVNDVRGLQGDMLRVCAEAGAPAAIMHMQGEPRTMQAAPRYDDVMTEVTAFLNERARAALAAGVPSVLIDPGIGFGKTPAHNLTLLRGLRALTDGPHPVLVGASRKRLIETLAGPSAPHERDPGSLAVHLHAATHGAAVVRAHDAAGHVQALRVHAALQSALHDGRTA